MQLLTQSLLAACLSSLALAEVPTSPSLDWHKLHAEVSAGAYLNEHSDDGGPAVGLGLGYQFGEGAVLLQARRYSNLSAELGSTVAAVINCSLSSRCEQKTEDLSGINLLYRARPLSWFSYGLGVGTLSARSVVEVRSSQGALIQREETRQRRTTLPYELLLHMGPSRQNGRQPWSVYVGLQGQVCKTLCNHGLYLGVQTGL